MRILLDTHVFLWANADPDRLGDHRALVEDPRNDLVVSAASSWELAIKTAIGRIALPEPPSSYVPSRIRHLGATPLAVEHPHALAVADLPDHHRDPFDRLLVAQAQLVGLTLLTADRRLLDYDADVLLIG